SVFLSFSLFFFFFQAEDGIRDRNVTGVQTCALPISGLPHSRYRATVRRPAPAARLLRLCRSDGRQEGQHRIDEPLRELGAGERRSEERRVGKECRSRGSP